MQQPTMQQPTILLSGVDTLIINVKPLPPDGTPPGTLPESQELPVELVIELQTLQEQAAANDAPFPTRWKHEGQTMMMAPRGVRGWTWWITNGLLDVTLGPLLNHAALARVRFSSEYLWRCGVERAVADTRAWLTQLLQVPMRSAPQLLLQVAELHLCADVMGLDIPKDYERVFVSRAKVERPILESHLDQPVYRAHRLETVQFSGHAAPMSATIYDKVREIEIKSKKTWFYPLWEPQGWSYDTWKAQDKEEKHRTTVRRVECRLKRPCLHEMDIEDIETALAKIPALWAYGVGHLGCTDGWLRMVSPNDTDTNRWRWETSDAWKVVQQAFVTYWHGAPDMADIQRYRKRQVNLAAGEAAIAGYATTYAAWLQKELEREADVSVVLHRLYKKMVERWEKRGVDFQGERAKKELLYHLT